MSAYTALLDQVYDAKACPVSTRLFLGRKFVLPAYRAPDYFNQDELNRMALMNLILLTMPGSIEKIDEVTRGTVGNVMMAAACGRPCLFLEKELGEILLGSSLPSDLETGDIKRLFPSLRIMLPKGLLTIERAGITSSMMYLDIGFLEAMAELACPLTIAAELDANSLKRFGPGIDRFHLSRMSFSYDSTCILVSGCLDRDEDQDDFSPTAYGLTKPWKPGPVSGLSQYQEKLLTSWPCDQADDRLLFQIENLALNILLLLSRVPLEYEPLVVERKERMEGKRTIPALLRAKFVGDQLVRARDAGHVRGETPVGYHVSAHWRRAHWVRQPHGPGRSLRKLIWLLPVHIGKKEAA